MAYNWDHNATVERIEKRNTSFKIRANEFFDGIEMTNGKVLISEEEKNKIQEKRKRK